MFFPSMIGAAGPFQPGADPNYPVPGSGDYKSGALGLSGVAYASQGTPYVPASVNTIPGTFAAGLHRYKYRDKPGGYSWNGTTSPGVNNPGAWDMTFPTGYQFVKSTSDTYVSWGQQSDTPENTNFCIQWLGYFQAPATASYNLYITSDDDSVVWVGNNAYNGNYTNSNFAAKVSNQLATNSNTMQLTATKWYPIRIWFSEVNGGCKFQFFLQQANGTKLNGSDITWAYNFDTGGF